MIIFILVPILTKTSQGSLLTFCKIDVNKQLLSTLKKNLPRMLIRCHPSNHILKIVLWLPLYLTIKAELTDMLLVKPS